MKNTLNYYYNLRIDKLIKNSNNYYFYINDSEYHLIKWERPMEDANLIFKLNVKLLSRGVMVHQMILNKDKQVITLINNEAYILLKILKYKSDMVSLNDIDYIWKHTYNIDYDKSLYRDNWVKLWCDKMDYYEYQINQLGKEYPILCNSLSYYIGLGENAISYLVNNLKNDNKMVVVAHKRIKIDNGSFEFYNPMNFIIDNRMRDLSEYIKNSFFNNKFNYDEIESFLDHNNINDDEYICLFSRLLFPTYYFDAYDDIINKKDNEEKILPILDRVNDYEVFLFNIYNYIVYKKKVHLEPLEWLFKNYS